MLLQGPCISCNAMFFMHKRKTHMEGMLQAGQPACDICGVSLCQAGYDQCRLVAPTLHPWRRAWDALMLAAFMNLRAGLYYELLSCFMGKGDKETFAAALAAVGAPYTVIATPLGSAGLRRKACRHVIGAGDTACMSHDALLLRLPVFLYRVPRVLVSGGHARVPGAAATLQRTEAQARCKNSFAAEELHACKVFLYARNSML